MDVELVGQQYGRLTVLQYAGRIRGRKSWHCGCTCGNIKVLRQDNLTGGCVKSCGCLKRERRKRGVTAVPGTGLKFGKHARTYDCWQHMLERCYNPNYKSYHNYGGRGIRVCRRWWESFDNFLADMGEVPPGLTLDRRDNDRGYSPGNCRWATYAEQNQNKRDNVFLTYKGKTQILTVWARECGLHRATVSHRLKYGWTIERALTQAVQIHRTPVRS